ncbi:hypothetical protein G6F40_018013 [Rhizopus arrhizus]|nr:hypothetical protein G6F40_018013 [Rhizopus arrhizus]
MAARWWRWRLICRASLTPAGRPTPPGCAAWFRLWPGGWPMPATPNRNRWPVRCWLNWLARFPWPVARPMRNGRMPCWRTPAGS